MRCASTSEAVTVAKQDRLNVNWSTRTSSRCYSRQGAGSRPLAGMQAPENQTVRKECCCAWVATVVGRMKRPLGLASSRGFSILALASLAACSQPSLNPANWYHALEGGKVADERPAPPQVNAPYPNLASVPQRPAPIDAAARGLIAQGLVADRTNAQYSASLAPLTAPPNPVNRPLPPAPRAAGEEAAGASLPAATAQPAAPAVRPIGPLGPPQANLPNVPMTAPRAAPTKTVASSALPPPAAPSPAAAEDAPTVGARADAVLRAGRSAEPAASLPSVPEAPPPPPMLPGAVAEATPPSVPKAALAPTAVVAAPSAPAAEPATSVGAALIAFQAGSSELPASALVSLKMLSQQRGGNPIAVTGYGDLASTEANAQARALPLALERARVVAARLLAIGVPAAAIRINAEAQGRGAAARIVR